MIDIRTFCKEGEVRERPDGKKQPLMLWVTLKKYKLGLFNVTIKGERNPLPISNIYCNYQQYKQICRWLKQNGWSEYGECYAPTTLVNE